ncbi:MAG: hypothetical protein M0R51_10090 [Clostridia bacterium]|jgi:hypothetical protein|nr:hypothetical protein [Clostridia bacterium]
MELDWQTILKEAITILGVIEFIKGFATHSGKTIDGNILRIIQFAVCMLIAVAYQYLPVFVQAGLLLVAVTTLCKTQIIDFVMSKFGDNKQTDNANVKTDATIDNKTGVK